MTNVASGTGGGEPVYPMPAPPDDGRFTYGLMIDVAAVLAKHGYAPVVAPTDLARLLKTLHRFLYRPAAFGPAKFGGLHAVAQAVEDDYGHDRIQHGDASVGVPAGVDGEAMTGRPVSGAPVGRDVRAWLDERRPKLLGTVGEEEARLIEAAGGTLVRDDQHRNLVRYRVVDGGRHPIGRWMVAASDRRLELHAQAYDEALLEEAARDDAAVEAADNAEARRTGGTFVAHYLGPRDAAQSGGES